MAGYTEIPLFVTEKKGKKLDRFHFHAEYMQVDKGLFHHSLVKQTMVHQIRMYAPSSYSKKAANKE